MVTQPFSDLRTSRRHERPFQEDSRDRVEYTSADLGPAGLERPGTACQPWSRDGRGSHAAFRLWSGESLRQTSEGQLSNQT